MTFVSSQTIILYEFSIVSMLTSLFSMVRFTLACIITGMYNHPEFTYFYKGDSSMNMKAKKLPLLLAAVMLFSVILGGAMPLAAQAAEKPAAPTGVYAIPG